MVVSLWYAMGIGAVPLVGWLLWWWNDIWYGLVLATLRPPKAKLPPGHMGFPIIGEMFTFLWYFKFLRRPDDYINSKRRKYGDGVGMYRTHLFGKPAVIVISPTANKFVLRDESCLLDWPNVEVVGKTSVVAVHGKQHARLRTFFTKSINDPQALRRIALTVQPRMIYALNSWAKSRTINSSKEIRKVTFENIGMYFANFKPGPTLHRLDTYFTHLLQGVRAYPINIPGSTMYRALQSREKAVAIFREELEKRRNNNNGSGDQPLINDLLDGLMNMKDEEGRHLSDTEVLDNIVSIVVAGYESTSLATMWAMYYLAKYPKVLQKLRDENMTLKKSKSEQLVTSDEILKLKYTFKVVDETIRLANVAAFIFRKTDKDINYKGYTIPKGWLIIPWLRYIHTDAENFKDPTCFDPDRWDVSMEMGTYQPFGGGLRLCAGNMLARLQLAIFLHHLTTGYKWALVNPEAKLEYLPHPKPEDGAQITIEKL